MRKLIALASTLVLLLGLLLNTALPALAEAPPVEVKKPEVRVGLGGVALLFAFGDVLSGPTWLVTQGLDPRFELGPKGSKLEAKHLGDIKGEIRLQAAAAAALVPYRDPSPKFSRNILIPRDFSAQPFQTEPHIAVNPKDPDHLLVGMIDYNFPNVTSYVSIDGGVTWEGPFQVKYPRGELASAGDPVVAFDRGGNAYISYISLNVEEFRIGSVVGEALVSSIALANSKDGGITWRDPVPAARSRISTVAGIGVDGRERGQLVLDFLDKPWMSLGPHPQDPQRTVLYLTYTRFTGYYELVWMDELPALMGLATETAIEVVRSEDGGFTWSRPLQVSPKARHILGGVAERFVQGSQPVVADDGTLYVAWLDTTEDGSFKGVAELYVARSENGGRSFSPPVRAALFPELDFRPRNAFFRNWASAFPQVAVGLQGEVYIVYASVPLTNPDDDGDAYFVRSLDRGQTWSRPKAINDDGSGRLQFFPTITTSPNGMLHALWGDMRHSPVETSYHIYYSSSEDKGETWTRNARVSDFPSNPNMGFPRGAFIGDYFSIKATEKDVYMVWADTRLGEFGPLNQKIAFSRQRLMPSPSIFISPPSGPGGQDVVIQGFNFQPDQNIFLEVGGVVVASGRTQPEGRFTSRIFVPISGEGAHEVRVSDASGNMASGSFFMDFGFGNIQQATRKLEQMASSLEATGEAVKRLETQSAELGELRQSVVELKEALAQQQSQNRLWLFMALGLLALLVILTITALAFLRPGAMGGRKG